MDNLKGWIKKVKLPDALQASPDKKSLKTINQQLEEKINEKNKLYGFMGMEVYDLSKENKIEIAQMKHYIDKIDGLQEEIQALEKQKATLETKGLGKGACTCGHPLNPQDRFCPQCGQAVAKTTLVCICGAEIPKGSKFCGTCGRSATIAQAQQGPVKMKPVKKCICGAEAPKGQALCFQCGRKIE